MKDLMRMERYYI